MNEGTVAVAVARYRPIVGEGDHVRVIAQVSPNAKTGKDLRGDFLRNDVLLPETNWRKDFLAVRDALVEALAKPQRPTDTAVPDVYLGAATDDQLIIECRRRGLLPAVAVAKE